ncbi:MAG: class B sortase [Solobacterium sp.]|nr:class B sortase [Solobacterium sp.]
MRLLKMILRVFDLITRLVCLLVLALGLYSAADTVYLYREAYDNSTLRFRNGYSHDGGFSEIQVPENAAGWLYLEGAGVDAPVMQGKDNLEYLNKNPAGEFSLSGSLFLDSRCAGDFTDSYSLIYGHHMEHHLMFGALDQYLEKDFFDSHPEGILYTGNDSYRLEIIAVAVCSAYEADVFSLSDDERVRAFIHTGAMYFRPSDMSGRILAMSTCQYPDTAARTVVFAMIREKLKGEDYEQSAFNSGCRNAGTQSAAAV